MIVTKTMKTRSLGISNGDTWQASAILINGNIEIELLQQHECLDYGMTCFYLIASSELDFNDMVFTEILIKWFEESEYELPDKLF